MGVVSSPVPGPPPRHAAAAVADMDAPPADAEPTQAVGALRPGLSRDGLIVAVAHAMAVVEHHARVVVAVSGGPDSTAMAHLLALARPDLELELVHVRHGLRDDAGDAAVAADHARLLELAHHEEFVTVEPGPHGPEAAARRARYDALLRRAARTDARWVAVGHTADDQAETVLLNLVRGAGLRGIGGMRAVREAGAVRVVRPLLRIRRSDVAAFVAGEGLSTAADPTNRDPVQRRARARHEALPALERLAGGPGDVVGSLNRLAALARADADALDALSAEHAARLVVPWGPTRAVRQDLLAMLPAALSTRVVRLAAAAVGATELPADAVARIVSLGPGAALHVDGGVQVTCGGDWLGFAPGRVPGLSTTRLVVPGETPLPQLGTELHVEWPWPLAPSGDPTQLDLGDPPPPTVDDVRDDRPPGDHAPLPPGPGPRARMWAVFGATVGQALAAGGDLVVRARRPGDRLRSGGGRRKLQDLMVDARVPRVCRDLLPVVVDEHDEPLWIPGVAQRSTDGDEAAALRLWLAPAPHPQPHADEEDRA